MEERHVEREEIGRVTHYFTNISVAVVELCGRVRKGDKIMIEGATTGFQQRIDSMQIEHEDVEEAGPGDEVGVKVKNRVRENDLVYKARE